MSRKRTRSRDADKGTPLIPQLSVTKFLQHVEERAWTEAEKELDNIRQKSDSSSWSRGYVKALEGLLLTYRSNDDKYNYLPKVLSERSEDSISDLRKEFAEFSSNELHGGYDRGYFKALEDYLALLGTLTRHATPWPTSVQNIVQEQTTAKNGE